MRRNKFGVYGAVRGSRFQVSLKWTSFLCKVDFSRQIFFLYFGKGKFGGKKFTLQKSEFYFTKEFLPFKIKLKPSDQ
jgi:hypothetical protein